MVGVAAIHGYLRPISTNFNQESIMGKQLRARLKRKRRKRQIRRKRQELREMLDKRGK